MKLGVVLGVLLPLAILLAPSSLSMEPRIALALCAFTVLFWTFEPVPIEYTSLLLLVLFPLSGVLSFGTTFSAFSGKTVWLVFAGMALSMGVSETPLGTRLAKLTLARVKSYNGLVLSLCALGLLSSLLIPSGVVRVLILMPLIVSFLDAIGERPGSRLSAAVILSFACSSSFAGTGVLTASVPNLVVHGVMESRGHTIFWGEWTYLLPAIGLGRVVLCYILVRLLFGSSEGARTFETPTEELDDNLSAPERRMVLILLLGVAAWATDFIHGMHPAFVGLILVLLAYLPGWGPLGIDQLKRVNFPLLIYIAASIAMGDAIASTGALGPLADRMTTAIASVDGDPGAGLKLITWLVIPFNFLADTAAIAAILTLAASPIRCRIQSDSGCEVASPAPGRVTLTWSS